MNDLPLTPENNGLYFHEIENCWGSVLINGDQNYIQRLHHKQIKENLESYSVKHISNEELLKWRSNEISYGLEHLKSYFIGCEIPSDYDATSHVKDRKKISNLQEVKVNSKINNILQNSINIMDNKFILKSERENKFSCNDSFLIIDIPQQREPHIENSYYYTNNLKLDQQIDRKKIQNIFYNEKYDINDINIRESEEIKYLKKIGSGGYGKVFLCIYKNQEVAVKNINISNEEDRINVLNTEIKIMKILKHINLVQYFGHCIKESSVKLIMELCKGGNLYFLLTNSNLKLSIKQKLKISLDIASGLNYLHSQSPPIIHRDIKSMNILLFDDLIDSDSVPLAKIADLGISKIFECTNSKCFMTQCGTPQWTAPEILRGEPYGTKSDIYSFSILLWEIFSERIPYCEYDLNKLQIAIQVASNKNFRPGLNFLKNDTPEVIKNLIKNCWNDDPKLRLEIPDIYIKLKDLVIIEN